MMRRVRHWAAPVWAGVALALAVTAGPAMACSICLAAVKISPGQRLDNADRIVIAVPDRHGGWQIVEDIKGTEPVDPATLIDAAPAGKNDAAVLFLRDALGQRWSAFGRVDPDTADWLRRLVRVPAPAGGAPVSAQAWQQRLPIIWAEVAADDPLIKAIAEGDLARAPYRDLIAFGRTLSTEAVLQHLADGESRSCTSRLCTTMAHLAGGEPAPQRAPYILMLGAIGDDAARSWIDEAVTSASTQNDASDLSALLAADLEIRGPSRIGWIEGTYFRVRSRGVDEIEAALEALRLHAEAQTVIPRGDVVAAYASFVEARPQFAGFVATDLAEWKEWSLTGAFVALLNAEAIADPAGRFAAMSYVSLSADTEATARLAVARD